MNQSPLNVKLVGALANGLAILRYLNEAPGPTGVNQIARDLKINPSTCFSLLRTLLHFNLITLDQNTKTYGVGLGFLELAGRSLERGGYVSLIRPSLESLAQRHRVTLTLWQPYGEDRVILVDRADNHSAIRVHMSIGQRLPLLVGALGRCMAAFSEFSEEEIERRFLRIRWQDAPPFVDFLSDVEACRKQGYAIDKDRYAKGVTTVAAPILRKDGTPLAAMSAIGFSAQFTKNSIRELVRDLTETAQHLSHSLSGEIESRSAGGANSSRKTPEEARAET
jgi:DNA-binding IclR family transcriptional regulator